MTLTLRIDNFDQLPDGGPIEYRVDQQGFEFGRDPGMDWTLPDPNRFVSSCHGEIRFENGAYWLHDVSTNGTLVNGNTMRVKSPYELQHGDKLQIGHYLVVVDMSAAAAGFAAAPTIAPTPPDPYGGFDAPDPAAAPAQPSSSDIWSVGGGAPPASGAGFDPTPPPPRQADIGDAHIAFPTFDTPAEEPDPTTDSSASPFGPPPTPAAAPTPETPPAPAAPMPAPPPAAPMSEGFAPMPQPPAQQPPAPEVSPFAAPAAPTPAPPAPAPPASGPISADDAGLLRAICEGAGMRPDALDTADPYGTAHEIGRALRIVSAELAGLLRARAATKQMVKSGSRTMIGHDANNPLKFIPTAEEALEVMFGQGRQGYQRGADAVQGSFNDVKKHQVAVYAAIQPALARLLEDISPEVIEKKVDGGRFSSKNAKAWEIFVERWDAKTHPYENGMLDVFLAYFSDAYDDAVNK